MTSALRWLGALLVAIGAIYTLALSMTFFGLPWWRFNLQVFTHLPGSSSLGLWPVAAGLGCSPFLMRDHRKWRLSLRLVALGYAATALVGASCWFTLTGAIEKPYAMQEFAQLIAAAAPLWLSAVAAFGLGMFARLDRRLAAVLIVVTFGTLCLISRVTWVPYLIPFLRGTV